MRIRCFTTGRVRPKAGEHGVRRYLPGAWRPDTLPVNVFLVEHSDGLCLFDAGQTARAAARGYFPAWHPFFRLARFELDRGDEAAAQLRAAGFDPAAVRWVILSHLHTDHVGGIEPFAHAELLVSRTEWERARGIAGRVRGYLPQHWPAGVEPRCFEFDGERVGPFAGSHDVAGDGKLLLVPTPGHTPGHTALLVRDERRSYLLGGDLAHSASELDETAPAIARFCHEEGVVFLAAHDSAAADRLAEAA